LEPRTSRELKLQAAHVVCPGADRIRNDRLGEIERTVGLVRHALNTRPEAPDIEAAQADIEETVGQADCVDPWTRRLLQWSNIAALTMSRENPPAADRVELGRVEARANVTNLSAEAGEVFRPGKPLTAGRPDSIRVVIDRREADDRGQALAEFVAEV